VQAVRNGVILAQAYLVDNLGEVLGCVTQPSCLGTIPLQLPATLECILIVGDEPAVARGLEYGLTREGFEVLWADTGLRAPDLARGRDPHLILLDIRLPDISGFDVCRQLRAEGKRQPILMLTAHDEELDKVLGLELGADDYVVKPYSLRELISRVRALLRRAYGELAAVSVDDRVRFGDVELDLERLRAT